MTKDYIADTWLDEIITHPKNADLFHDENQLAIQKELAGRWTKENRLELLNGLANQYGEESVFSVVDKIIDGSSRRNWAQTSKNTENSLSNFINLLWEPLKEEGFEYTFEKKGNVTTFNVTYCPVYENARKLGAEKWFYHFFCLTDEPSVVGFNNKIQFTRSKTLMQGCSICNHCYTDHSAE